MKSESHNKSGIGDIYSSYAYHKEKVTAPRQKMK